MNKKQKKSKKRLAPYIQADGSFHMSGTEVTLRSMPRYNTRVVGCGVHGDTKYNRRREKRDFARLLADER